MAKVFFQLVGVLVLSYSCIFLLACLFVPRASALLTFPADYGRLIVVVATGTVLGIGVLHLRKWAAIAVSLLLLYPLFGASTRLPIQVLKAQTGWVIFSRYSC
jgi:hypothetical protein